MAKLNFKEKRLLEDLLDMHSGYVLDFSDRTFRDFIYDVLNIDIEEERFKINGSSKAKRFRTLLHLESEYNIAKVIDELCKYKKLQLQNNVFGIKPCEKDDYLFEEAYKLINRLKSTQPVNNINIINPNNNELDFKKLAESIKKELKSNNPDIVLDRLHTFLMRYVRELCHKHRINFNQNESLNALFGKYVKYLEASNLFESEATKVILKSNISIFEKLNGVRNNQSFAHANTLLNYNESLLIVNNILSSLTFIESLELNIN